MEKMIRITVDLIQAGRSRRGAWTRKQLALIGVAWPPPKGWKRRIIGEPILESVATEFVALRDCHLPSTDRNALSRA